MLKNVLEYLLAENRIDKDSKISLFMFNSSNKKLLKFYQDLLFKCQETEFSTTVKELLEKLSFYSTLNMAKN